jgi:hypothetical protein
MLTGMSASAKPNVNAGLEHEQRAQWWRSSFMQVPSCWEWHYRKETNDLHHCKRNSGRHGMHVQL